MENEAMNTENQQLAVSDQQSEPEKECCCYEYAGDNPKCPVHGDMYPHPKDGE